MNRHLARDLARWEAGDASLDDLARRHPRADVAALTALRTRLSHLGDAPSPDPAVAWASVASRLTDREVAAPRSRRLRRPMVVAIIAATLAVPTVSYAAPDAVRSTWRKVADLVPGLDDSHPRPGDDGTPPAAVPNPVGEHRSTSDPHQPSTGTQNSTDARDNTSAEDPVADDDTPTAVVESDDPESTSTTEVHADDDGTPPPAGSTTTTDADGAEPPSTDS
jgi:hypothetical protein